MVTNEVSTIRRKSSRIELFFPGRIPSKKNNEQIFINRKTGKRFVTASKRYKEWEAQELKNLASCDLTITPPCRVTCFYTPKDRRAFDLSNKRESIQDLLVKAEILEEDNFKIVQQNVDKVCPVDKDKCGIRVVLETLDEKEAVDFS